MKVGAEPKEIEKNTLTENKTERYMEVATVDVVVCDCA